MRHRSLLVSLLLILTLVSLYLLFTFRLLEVPPGMDVDEATIGYNADLISKTLHDSNGRFLPVFILSEDHIDWHQPTSVYLTAAVFKLLGPSFWNLRLTSVLIILTTIYLLFFLLYKTDGVMKALFGILIFITTPIIMFQSHMATEQIAPLPFLIIWLYSLYQYQRSQKLKYLALGAVCLGITFYSYKGMRLITPIWTLTSLGFIVDSFIKTKKYQLVKINLDQMKKLLIPVLIFSIFIFPFYAIAPILELKYGGAVFDRNNFTIDSYQQFFLPYLSSFDPSFLYITGDATPFHSTGKHGFFLLASLPFFLLGLYRSSKLGGFYLFLVICFFVGPLLFGLANSVHRASRLVSLVPLYAIICIKSWEVIGELIRQARLPVFKLPLRLVSLILVLLIGFNFYSFAHFYWFKYRETVRDSYWDTDESYLNLASEAKKRGLNPYVEQSLFASDYTVGKFLTSAYFNKPLGIWVTNTPVPQNAILLTNLHEIKDMERLDLDLKRNLQINKKLTD